ncbi:MAG: hypothetical protein AAGA92_02125 [Planctomycetota bacterium]
MARVVGSMVLLLWLSALPAACAQELAKIPPAFQKHLEKMVGSWTFEGHEGARKFSGEETVRLINHKTVLVQEGFFDLGGGAKERYFIVSGWDGVKKTMLVRGFTSDGYTWSGEWKKLQDGRWEGTASGGVASFEVTEDAMRYEDANDGTPWVSEFRRKEVEE